MLVMIYSRYAILEPTYINYTENSPHSINLKTLFKDAYEKGYLTKNELERVMKVSEEKTKRTS